MNDYLKELRQLPELGSLDTVLEKWELLRMRMQAGCVKTRNLLPELFLQGTPGVGRSHLLALLSSYLRESELLAFQGEREFIEFRFEYCSEDESFKELNRFVNKLSDAAGYRSRYKGVICIELDEWIERFKERYFSVFTEYLEEHCEDWLLIFSVNGGEEKKIEELCSYLSMYFRLDPVVLSVPTSEEYLDYLGVFLEEQSFALSEEAKQVLRRSVEVLKTSPLFDGYKSINRLGMDIAYEKYTGEVFWSSVINEADVEMFSPGSRYIQGMLKNYSKKQPMGFVYGGDTDDK